MTDIKLHERVTGGLWGLLVGDAVGVPYEFHSPESLPSMSLIDMSPPRGFPRAHVGVPAGTWSDDGAQALILLDSLLSNDGLDLQHFASGLRRWLHEGFYAVNRAVFDVGAQTSTAINRLVGGCPPESAGPATERHNGNGSLMRVLPLALWHVGEDTDLVVLAIRQSLPTHGHARAQVCCALYCLWARAALHGKQAPWDWAVARLNELASETGLDPAEVALVTAPENAAAIHGSGYVLDTLWSARASVLAGGNYAGCVRAAIALGHDTDTTACVAGGMAGILHGHADIPAQWREGLRGKELVRPLLERLLARHASTPGAAFSAR